MDFHLGERAQTFRQEVRAFLEKELPPDWEGYEEEAAESYDYWAFHRAFNRKLGERRWLALGWPEEWGGGARSLEEQMAFAEEMGYHKAPFYSRTVGIVGPFLMACGSEAQKRRFLLPMARGEVEFCLAFTEPGAGSDLASAQCRATQEGDHFIIEGQKSYISNAHHADYCFLVARTDPQAPRHRGLSLFLVGMKSPGVKVRPTLNMLGYHCFNEVFFDRVEVPRRDMVGEKDLGWYKLVVSLDLERTVHGAGIVRAAFYRRTLEELAELVKGKVSAAGRGELADLAIAVEVFRWLCYRVAWRQGQGTLLGHEAAVTKVMGGELCQRLARVGMGLLGLYGQLRQGSKHALWRGKMERLYLSSIPLTIAGGSAEVQRGIIALRGLGLPR
ncbi:MAG: acyl-CoA dehydrogenase family protein [Chloroflexota bacterium]|nr:acyl-CoA dehydrogenase family protein [Chloroflexota bacterium]